MSSTTLAFLTVDSPAAQGARQRIPTDDRGRLPNFIAIRRRLPGEVVTRSAAIRNFCRECLGWDPAGAGSMAEAVRRCTTEECWLHQWRNGPLDNSDLEVEATSR